MGRQECAPHRVRGASPRADVLRPLPFGHGMNRVFRGTALCYALVSGATGHEEAPYPLATCAVHLDDAQKVRLLALLNQNEELFTNLPGCTDLASHASETGDALPLKYNPWSVSLAKRQGIDGLLDEVLSADIIRHSSAPGCRQLCWCVRKMAVIACA